MKKIINGRIYESTNSELIWKCLIHWKKEYGHKFYEELYKSPKWQYFLIWYYKTHTTRSWIKIESYELINILEIIKWIDINQDDFTKKELEKLFKYFEKVLVKW